MSDGNGGFDEATVFVTVKPATSPKAYRDSYEVDEDSKYADAKNTLAVRDNDKKNPDPANWLPISVVPTTEFPNLKAPEHGTVRVLDDSHIQYEPDPDYFGPDSFEYVIDDNFVGDGDVPSAPSKGLVTINVIIVNNAPVADPDLAETTEETRKVDSGPGQRPSRPGGNWSR